MRRTGPLMLAVTLLTATLVSLPATAAVAAVATERISGVDRYATAVAVSRAAFPQGAVPVVVIASGVTFADGVSAGTAAAALGGPLLLTMPSAVPASIRAEITRLAPSRIVIAGGPSTISDAVARELETLAPEVVRIAGIDRYETSEGLARLAFLPDSLTPAEPDSQGEPLAPEEAPSPTQEITATPAPEPTAETTPEPTPSPEPTTTAMPEPIATASHTPTPTPTPAAQANEVPVTAAEDPTAAAAPLVYLATGANFADALSGAGLAAAEGAPVITVPGTQGQASASLLALLDDLGTSTVRVLGGTPSVSDALAQSLRAPGRTIERIAGVDRYQTATLIAQRYPNASSEALIASGVSFPDALSSIALSVQRRAPILLSQTVCAPDTVRSHISGRGIGKVTIIGGVPTLRGLVASLTPCRSTVDPTSTWVMVNKHNPLSPVSYVPPDLRTIQGTGALLRSEAATAFEQLRASTQAAGYGWIGVNNGYRSYSTQAAIHSRYSSQYGFAWADTQSARAGFSEHQTGLSLDVTACGNSGCSAIESFGSSIQYQWVASHAWEHGFIIRYQDGYTATTGYVSEPWHLRYVGRELAKDYYWSGYRTLEDYLGYPAARHY